MTNTRMTDAQPRFDRDGAHIWVTGALDVIARDGVQALRIERLARHVGVSKGSFYWFFPDLDALKMQALLYWRDTLNAPVFEAVRAEDGPLNTRLMLLIKLVSSGRLGRYDGAIRSWALVDPRARAFVRQVDRERMAFMEEIFTTGSGDPCTATLRAHVFYRSFIAESYVRTYPDGADSSEFMSDVASFLAHS